MATTKKKTGTVKVASRAASRTTQKKTEMVKAAKKRPVVSVVMPAHNAADFIDDAIHSVLGQTFADFELLIVDDASTDKTLEVVGQFGDERIRVISCKRNGGAAKARNRGVRAARGRYIAFIDADDLWQPSKLEKQVAFMRERNSAFSFGSYVFADAKGRPKGKVVRVPETISGRQVLKNNLVMISTVMFDMKKLGKNDVKIEPSGEPGRGKWQRVFEKVGEACGMSEVVAILGYDTRLSIFERWRRRV